MAKQGKSSVGQRCPVCGKVTVPISARIIHGLSPIVRVLWQCRSRPSHRMTIFQSLETPGQKATAKVISDAMKAMSNYEKL